MDKKFVLTDGERAFFHRRRACVSQSKMGKVHGLSRNMIGLIEKDEAPIPESMVIGEIELSDKEQLVLLRKRNGLSQKDVADSIGVSRFWVNRMERGQVNGEKLESYWSNNEK